MGSKYMARDGFHLFSQCNLDGHRSLVHNTLRDCFATMIRGGGFTVRIESSATLQLSNHDTQRRTDITILGSKLMELDVSVTDPRVNIPPGGGGIPEKYLIPGAQAAEREKQKCDKYEAEVTKVGASFFPIVVETFGRFGEGARKSLTLVQVSISGIPIHVLRTYWTQRLLVAMRLAALKGARRLALVVTRGRGVVDENANLEDFLYASMHIYLPQLMTQWVKIFICVIFCSTDNLLHTYNLP